MNLNNQHGAPMPVRKDAYIKNAGPVSFESRISDHEGDVMSIASREVVMIPPTTTIMGAAKTMLKYGFRRLPVADAGTNRLVGIVTSLDIADFMGGGLRHNLLQNRFHGNLLAAVNESVREIMEENVASLSERSSLKDALQLMIEKNIGGVPIVDDDERVKAIISERDFVWLIDGMKTGKKIEECMSRDVVSISPDLPVGEVTNSMMKHGFRRFPVRKNGMLFGIVSATDVLRYLASGEVFHKLVGGDSSDALSVPVKELIKKNVITVTPEKDLGEAAHLMVENKIGSLPVVKGERLVGIITERDFIKSIV
jgi:CBS domain-containing protein